ncbi:uncharacterized protein LOC144491100 isoform X2 [Mustelus asterias]
MAEQPLAEMVEIAVRELASEAQAVQQSSPPAEDEDANHTGKRRRVEAKSSEAEEGEDNIQTLLYAASKTLCLRLDTIEAHLNSMEEKCKCLRAKVDMLANQNAQRPLLAEQAANASSTSLPRKSCRSSGDSAEAAPTSGGGTVAEPQEGGPGERQQQGLGPGVHIVALCAEGPGGQGEAEEEEEEEEEDVEGDQGDGGVALLPDATNLLYQLMY